MTQGFQETNVKMPSNINEREGFFTRPILPDGPSLFIVDMVYCMYVDMSVRHHFKEVQR